MIVADTDVLIDFLRNTTARAETVERLIADGALATTVISVAELVQGGRGRKHREAIVALLDALEIIDATRATAELAGDTRRGLLAVGQDIGLADCIIAAICLHHGHTLLTGNRRHFARIAGLRLAPD